MLQVKPASLWDAWSSQCHLHWQTAQRMTQAAGILALHGSAHSCCCPEDTLDEDAPVCVVPSLQMSTALRGSFLTMPAMLSPFKSSSVACRARMLSAILEVELPWSLAEPFRAAGSYGQSEQVAGQTWANAPSRPASAPSAVPPPTAYPAPEVLQLQPRQRTGVQAAARTSVKASLRASAWVPTACSATHWALCRHSHWRPSLQHPKHGHISGIAALCDSHTMPVHAAVAMH